jgi:CRISPR-associated protein Csx14
MAETSIPVDLTNPGQVFACLGFVEAADQLLGSAEGAFDWSAPATCFHIRASGEENPISTVLEFLEHAEAVPEAVEGSPNIAAWKPVWGPVPRALPRDEGYPFPDPASPATLVCALIAGPHRVPLTHWGEDRRITGRDNMKLWAGASGYPGAALARDALALIRGKARDAASEPFALALPQSSSFRLDWRRDYVPIEAGFSLNNHGHIAALGYPFVELLGAVGLSHARPLREEKLVYRYGVVGRDHTTDALWLSPSLLRAALGGSPLPFPMRHFRLFMSWPGQENQARAITTVTEEVSS